jgi:hypothetical protein
METQSIAHVGSFSTFILIHVMISKDMDRTNEQNKPQPFRYNSNGYNVASNNGYSSNCVEAYRVHHPAQAHIGRPQEIKYHQGHRTLTNSQMVSKDMDRTDKISRNRFDQIIQMVIMRLPIQLKIVKCRVYHSLGQFHPTHEKAMKSDCVRYQTFVRRSILLCNVC